MNSLSKSDADVVIIVINVIVVVIGESNFSAVEVPLGRSWTRIVHHPIQTFFFFSRHPVEAELSTSSPSQVIHPLITTTSTTTLTTSTTTTTTSTTSTTTSTTTTKTTTSHLAWKSIIRTGNATDELSRRNRTEYQTAEELWHLSRKKTSLPSPWWCTAWPLLKVRGPSFATLPVVLFY